MTDISPTPPSNVSPSSPGSGFNKVRIVVLCIILGVLIILAYFLWGIFQVQQRADYIISGEDLFRTGIIDKIVKIVPSRSAPTKGDLTTLLQDQSQSPPPTVAISAIAKGEQTYFIRTSGTGPKLTKLVVNELDPAVGGNQAIRVDAEHSQNIDSVKATLKTDHQTQNYTLHLSEGSATKGVWSAEWPVADTHDFHYTLILEATSQGQPVSTITLTFR